LPAVPNPLPLEDAKGGALNLTRFSGIGAALVLTATTFNDSWDTIFGEETPKWAKPVVIIAVIAAFVVVAAADILARGYAAGQRAEIIPMPDGLRAELIPGPAQTVRVAAVRFRRTEDDSSEFLIVKDDQSTTWVGREDLKFRDNPAQAGN
jgi:hypothetical protein